MSLGINRTPKAHGFTKLQPYPTLMNQRFIWHWIFSCMGRLIWLINLTTDNLQNCRISSLPIAPTTNFTKRKFFLKNHPKKLKIEIWRLKKRPMLSNNCDQNFQLLGCLLPCMRYMTLTNKIKAMALLNSSHDNAKPLMLWAFII
jgi:hypothetical protein